MKPPSRLWLLVQPLAIIELSLYILMLPFILWKSPKGRGPILILPGFLMGDWYMWPMKMTLTLKGYEVYGWGFGMNKGFSEKINEKLIEKIEKINKESGGKISLIGYSLGGIYARNIASLHPELVKTVFTISTPFTNLDESINIQGIYRLVSGERIEKNIPQKVAERIKKNLPALTISFFSSFDGIVSLESCIEPEDSKTFNHEVVGTHCGLPHNHSVMKIVLEELSKK